MFITRFIAALGCSIIASTAVALPDNYSLGSISLNGNEWTDGTTVVTTGQAYDVSVQLSYQRPVLVLPSSTAGYQSSHSLALQVNGNTLGMAAAAAPSTFSDGQFQICVPVFFGRVCGNRFTQVTSASWDLQGSIMFDAAFAPVGMHDVNFVSNGIDPFSRQLTVAAAQPLANPVPAPGTLAIFALGLFGLVGARRWKQRS